MNRFIYAACAALWICGIPSPGQSAVELTSAPKALQEDVATSAARAGVPAEAAWTDRPEWKKHFDQEGLTGTFLLFDADARTLQVYDRERAGRAFIPASTFKILNSLIALETGAVRDEHESIRWDGVERMPDWNKDHTMRTAFPASAVPFYQELARRIGQDRMQKYADRAGDGNRDLSGGIDQFWLKGGLRITPVEQIDFLVRLHRNELPFSPRTLSIVKDVMVREKTDSYVLRGKTGWAFDFEPQIGWFVGYVERDKKAWFFALNADMTQPKDAQARIAITERILREEGLLK